MTRQQILDWLKQPTTQWGICIEIVAAGAYYSGLLHGPLEQFIPWINAGAAALLFPDNSTDRIKVQDMTNGLLHAAVTRNPQAMAEAIASGIEKVAQPAPVQAVGNKP